MDALGNAADAEIAVEESMIPSSASTASSGNIFKSKYHWSKIAFFMICSELRK